MSRLVCAFVLLAAVACSQEPAPPAGGFDGGLLWDAGGDSAAKADAFTCHSPPDAAACSCPITPDMQPPAEHLACPGEGYTCSVGSWICTCEHPIAPDGGNADGFEWLCAVLLY